MKLSMQQIELLNVLESRTGAQGKDVVLLEDKIVFMVPKSELGRAVGRGGSNVERLVQAVGKPVDIVEYSEDEQDFVKGLFAPVQPDNIEVREGTVFVRFQAADKGRAIGRGGEKAARARTLLERYCNLKLKIL